MPTKARSTDKIRVLVSCSEDTLKLLKRTYSFEKITGFAYPRDESSNVARRLAEKIVAAGPPVPDESLTGIEAQTAVLSFQRFLEDARALPHYVYVFLPSFLYQVNTVDIYFRMTIQQQSELIAAAAQQVPFALPMYCKGKSLYLFGKHL